jgi:hypothetical protein
MAAAHAVRPSHPTNPREEGRIAELPLGHPSFPTFFPAVKPNITGIHASLPAKHLHNIALV